ncbi:O-methyltransferase gedA [Lasiodiplodia theobromae]|uniref:O-methyltransferase gedA n=1 Tax=Lasiodiplodia theobromae TaxID=45133 RepID=A0A5N5CUJ0_9PEZI|nr:O-methyltransferase gedA [Lasiodiplodia theobromae]
MESREDQIGQLRQLCKLLTENIEVVINEWKKEKAPNEVPSKEAYEAQRILTSAMGKVRELVVDPRYQIMEISQRYTDSRALFIAVERRVADLLEDGEGDGKQGCSLEFLAEKTGVERRKLGKYSFKSPDVPS